MQRWECLASAQTADSAELRLYRRGCEYVLRADGHELMSSRAHGSEEALARLGCGAVRDRRKPSVLIGGLGFGYTLRAALDTLPADASVVVVELVPEVVEWNRDVLGSLAGQPLDDPRVRVLDGDVAKVVAEAAASSYDSILLDADNGPVALTRTANKGLYDRRGIERMVRALRVRGCLAVWSASDAPCFEARLRDAGLQVARHAVPPYPGAKRTRHIVWVATPGNAP